MAQEFDVAIIGSGFGGSVAALRLSEKGYRVLVIEAGARFEDHDFAKNSFDLKRFLFFPRLGLRGIQRIDLLRNVLVLSGAGVGGGSLVYANTLYRPGSDFYRQGPWAELTDWESALEPYFEQAERMLGVEPYPRTTSSDEALLKVASEFGYQDSFRKAPLGIFFGESGKTAADPYFGGVGPDRTGCLDCGECMTGCRHGAKNTLVKNYLYLAERLGAKVWPLTEVTELRKLEDGSFELRLRSLGRGASDRLSGASRLVVPQVIVAAGALGSAKLLHRMKAKGNLKLSDQLGSLSRTNSESLLGVVSKTASVDFSVGPAITSSVFPNSDTHIEPVRYGRGSGFMGLLQSVLASGKRGQSPNPLRLVFATLRSLLRLPNFYNLRTWPERTLILLVMQARDNSLETRPRGGRRLAGWLEKASVRTGLTSRQGHGEKNPAWVPEGHQVARALARDIDGTAGAVIGEPFGIPLTAHFLGGAVIGKSAADSVVDGYLRAHGVPGLHIFDGSTLTANPGVNPSLAITAQAEWAAAHWPNLGEADPRPALGERFVPVAAVPPRNPAVPASAKAALKLPLRVKARN